MKVLSLFLTMALVITPYSYGSESIKNPSIETKQSYLSDVQKKYVKAACWGIAALGCGLAAYCSFKGYFGPNHVISLSDTTNKSSNTQNHGIQNNSSDSSLTITPQQFLIIKNILEEIATQQESLNKKIHFSYGFLLSNWAAFASYQTYKNFKLGKNISMSIQTQLQPNGALKTKCGIELHV